jgi:hypothetical protein
MPETECQKWCKVIKVRERARDREEIECLWDVPENVALFSTTIQHADTAFSPLTPTALDFIIASMPPATLSRQPWTSLLHSLKKTLNNSNKKNSALKTLALSSMLEHIAMASASASAGTLKLGKQRTSNIPANPWPTKNCSAHAVGKLDNNLKGSGSTAKDGSEAECEEVQ